MTEIKRKPSIIHQTVNGFVVELQLHIDEDIEDFNGHFPVYSLLPGVTQIDWAIFFAKQYLSIPGEFQGMEVIKFQEPILKGSDVTLKLEWHDEKGKLYFSYTSQDNDACLHTHSSGRILLA